MGQPFWGRGASDWIEIQEPLHRPLYEALLDSLNLPPGAALFDAGCGSGVVSMLAVERGADVTGLDASPQFIDIARTRCPQARFMVGDLREPLPFDKERFDAMVFCNSLQYVPNPIVAVREAARVLRNGGPVAIAVFDVVEKCEGAKPITAIVSLLPQADPNALGPFALSKAGQLEGIVREAGLECASIRSVDVPWHYRDLETARRAFISAGPSQHVRELGLEAELAERLDAANAEFRRSDGTYVLGNSFRIVVGRKAA
jgi:SAM-dependent methyltransferase